MKNEFREEFIWRNKEVWEGYSIRMHKFIQIHTQSDSAIHP